MKVRSGGGGGVAVELVVLRHFPSAGAERDGVANSKAEVVLAAGPGLRELAESH